MSKQTNTIKTISLLGGCVEIMGMGLSDESMKSAAKVIERKAVDALALRDGPKTKAKTRKSRK